MTAVSSPGIDRASAAAAACIEAAEATARCAAACLATGPSALDTSDCAEWCVVTARTLGAISDVIERAASGHQRDLAVALCRAAVIAADECAAEAEVHASRIRACAVAAGACRRAGDELRELLDDLRTDARN